MEILSGSSRSERACAYLSPLREIAAHAKLLETFHSEQTLSAALFSGLLLGLDCGWVIDQDAKVTTVATLSQVDGTIKPCFPHPREEGGLGV